MADELYKVDLTEFVARRKRETPFTIGERLAYATCVGLSLVLPGYLIFNRTFAKLGWPPVYVGEMMLALGMAAALFHPRTVFYLNVKRSGALQLIALFACFGMVRIVVDMFSHGLD